jgi:hypothetical protein
MAAILFLLGTSITSFLLRFFRKLNDIWPVL